MMVYFTAVTQAWLGSMFVYSAGLKLARYDRASSLVKQYQILPTKAAYALGFVLPWIELLVGALFLLEILFPLGPVLGAFMGFSFAYASLHVLQKKLNVSCGCTGSTQDRVTKTTLVRALAIAAGSFFVMSVGREGEIPIPIIVVAILFIAALIPGVLTFCQRMRNLHVYKLFVRKQDEEIRRLERLLETPIIVETGIESTFVSIVNKGLA